MDEIVERLDEFWEALSKLVENPELFKEAAEAMKEHQADRFRARRATTINFLNRMSEEGFLTYREATTKGGTKRIYRPSDDAPDEESFRRSLAERITRKVHEVLRLTA